MIFSEEIYCTAVLLEFMEEFRIEMSKGLDFARMALLAGLAILPSFAADAPPQTRSCWLRDLSSPTTSNIYALCEQGSVWFSGDGGTTWAAKETGAKEALRAMDFLDANRGLAVGDAGLIMSTTDASKTWTAVKSGTEKKLMDISFVENTGWVVGYNGLILHTADGGRTWSEQKSGTTQTIESVFFLDAQHGWAIGWAGTILRTADGGKTWEAIKTDAATWSLSSVYFRDLQNGWIVGFAGQIIRSSDGGKNCKPQTSPIKVWLTSVEFDKLNRGWITHDDGVL